MKLSKLEDHLRRCPADKTGEDLKYFQTLKENVQKSWLLVDSMFASTSKRDDGGLQESYNISLLIAKPAKAAYYRRTANVASH